VVRLLYLFNGYLIALKYKGQDKTKLQNYMLNAGIGLPSNAVKTNSRKSLNARFLDSPHYTVVLMLLVKQLCKFNTKISTTFEEYKEKYCLIDYLTITHFSVCRL